MERMAERREVGDERYRERFGVDPGKRRVVMESNWLWVSGDMLEMWLSGT